MKKLVIALTALGLLAGSATALAAKPPCKDKAGRFVKCPAPPAQCRDKSGHFIKCPAKPTVCRNAQGHYAKCK